MAKRRLKQQSGKITLTYISILFPVPVVVVVLKQKLQFLEIKTYLHDKKWINI